MAQPRDYCCQDIRVLLHSRTSSGRGFGYLDCRMGTPPTGGAAAAAAAATVQDHCWKINDNDQDSLVLHRLLLWIRVLFRMGGLFLLLFVSAMALWGHSTRSCLLLLTAPGLNYFILAQLTQSSSTSTTTNTSTSEEDSLSLMNEMEHDDNAVVGRMIPSLQQQQVLYWTNVVWLILASIATLSIYMHDYQTSLHLLSGTKLTSRCIGKSNEDDLETEGTSLMTSTNNAAVN